MIPVSLRQDLSDWGSIEYVKLVRAHALCRWSATRGTGKKCLTGAVTSEKDTTLEKLYA